MDINTVLDALLPIVFALVGVALIVFIVELIKTLKVARTTIVDVKSQLDPTLKNVETITTDIQPALTKVDPLMDRVQLTVDSVNLEMMRVDQILEDVSEITDTASSATAAVDNITNAPIKAVSNVATRMKSAFGGKHASDESAQLAEQRVAVAQALEDYKAEEKKAEQAKKDEAPASAPAAWDQPEWQDAPNDSYVGSEEPSPLVIDPKVIQESPFFDDDAK